MMRNLIAVAQLLLLLFGSTNADSSASTTTSATTLASTPTAASSGTYTYTYLSEAPDCPTPIPTTSLTELDSLTGSHQVQFYANPDGSVVDQVQIPAQNGNSKAVLIQTSNTSRIVLFTEDGQSAIIDNDGARLFPPGCNSTLVLPIPNLAEALSALGGASQPQAKRDYTFEDRAELSERDSSSLGLPVTINFIDQCSNPIVGHEAVGVCDAYSGGGLASGESDYRFALIASADKAGAYIGACLYPNPTPLQANCVPMVLQRLQYPTTGVPGELTGVKGGVKQVQKWIKMASKKQVIRQLSRTVATQILELFSVPEVAFAMDAISVYQFAAKFAGPNGIPALAKKICAGVAVNYIDIGDELDTESGITYEYRVYGPPFTAVTATRTVSISSITCSPTPCATAGSCDAGYPVCGFSQNNCWCGADTLGALHCVQNDLCSHQRKCAINADCPSGSICLDQHNCCGYPTCAVVGVCANGGSAKRLFRRQQGPTLFSL